MWGKNQGESRSVFHQTDVILALSVIGLVLLLVVPLPAFLLDLFLCLNIVFSVMTLLLTLYVEEALEFSSFPAALLFLTLYRLGLNIASTRMILTHAEGGDIIRTFGEFVTEGHVGVGLILFALLTTINFVVVTKGAGRVAEVAARFTLEALPGKQMAIDAELNGGLLSQEEAKLQHKKIEQEAEFYGAMDGASKFVRGDAIAGILITAVNIIGGLLVGLCVKGMTLGQSWQLFTRLTVGDGLVSQLPALLVSIAAGIMVTRCSSQRLGQAISQQFFCHPKVLLITGCLLVALGLIPGMPLIVMGPIAALLFLYARVQLKQAKISHPAKSKKHGFIELEVGFLSAEQMANLKEQVIGEVGKIERKLGINLPGCIIKHNNTLPERAFEVKIADALAGRGHGDKGSIAKQVSTCIASYCHELICRQDVVKMLEHVKKVDAAVVSELVPKKLSVGDLLAILQLLLKEQISIVNLPIILESIADALSYDKRVDREILVQKVRERLARSISEQFFGADQIAHAIRLDPKIEQMIDVSVSSSAVKTQERLRPQFTDKITEHLKVLHAQSKQRGESPILVTDSHLRAKVRGMIEHTLPDLPVLSYSEITQEVKLETIGVISKEVLLS